MSYTLTIRNDGTHESLYHSEDGIDREWLETAIGGRPYIEPLALNANAVTSENAPGRGHPNSFATAIAWAFGKTQTSYHGNVIITGGTDRRGYTIGLNHDQSQALVQAVQVLNNKHMAGLPLQFVGDELKFLDYFQTPELDAQEQPEEEEKSKAPLIASCLVGGLLIGGLAGWGISSAATDDEESVTETITEEAEPDAEEEAGVTVDELNDRANELDEWETDLEDRESAVEDVDQRESDVDTREDDVASQEEELDSRESDVESREESADTRSSELDSREDDLDEREDDLDTRENELDNRENQLDEQESSLNDQPSEPNDE